MNAEQILRVYEERGDIIREMLECDIGDSGIVIDEEVLGVGVYGNVYSATFNGRKMAVKKVGLMKAMIDVKKTLEYIYACLRNIYGLEDFDIFERVNEHWKNVDGKYIYIPSGLSDCRIKQELLELRYYSTAKTCIRIPKGSYLTTSIYSEFIISSLCSRLVEEGTSANFIKMLGYYTKDVDDPLNHHHYMFMDRIDGTLCEYVSIAEYIQVIHAIECYQTRYDIVHGDLHGGNVFWSYIKDDDEFNGHKLKDAEYFHYRMRDIDLYIPNEGKIMYIGDFGLAVKYQEPVIGPMRVLQRGVSQTPNFKTSEYDLLTFTEAISTAGDLFNKILKEAEEYVKFGSYGRPIVSDSSVKFSPYEVISRYSEFEEYFVLPEGKKIVTLGTI